MTKRMIPWVYYNTQIINWGGYYAVVSYETGNMIVHASRFRTRETAQKYLDRRVPQS